MVMVNTFGMMEPSSVVNGNLDKCMEKESCSYQIKISITASGTQVNKFVKNQKKKKKIKLIKLKSKKIAQKWQI